MFHPEARARYDVALTMYHDQGLIPAKTLAFDDGVNVTLGLPFVRTSPDHGTAFDIAGKGVANPASLIAALRLAGPADAMSLAADGLPPLREVVAAHGLEARKSLGQNFLFDLNLTRRIARAAGPLEGVAVVEVGPGPGGLTRALSAEGARKVIAIERDARALGALAEIAAHWPGRLEVIDGDALSVAPATLTAKAGGAPLQDRANLPYNIATPLLVGWLEAEPWPPFYDRLTLMFQREVARRIVATPAERADYGRLAVLAGWRTEARILFDVAPAAFTPPPKVTSSVVELIPRPAPEPCDAGDALGADPGRVRPAAQDAAPVAERLRRRPRPRPCRRSSPPRDSSRRCGPRRSTSRGSSRWLRRLPDYTDLGGSLRPRYGNPKPSQRKPSRAATISKPGATKTKSGATKTKSILYRESQYFNWLNPKFRRKLSPLPSPPPRAPR